jgi:1-acyl-sn-glycerol-3-phosphate acyltransferase
MNHYSRRGLRPYHIAMAVSDILTRRRPGEPEVRWVFTSEYRGRHIGPVPIPLWFIRWVFRRVAVVYGFVVIARREELVMARAAALRELLRAAGRAPIGMTPEGLESTGRLVVPPEGNGLLLAMLSRRGIPVLPVGAWEDGNVLCIRVGDPFDLRVPSGRPRAEQDRIARDRVMMAIGRLLPRPYWGAYEAALAAEPDARGSA